MRSSLLPSKPVSVTTALMTAAVSIAASSPRIQPLPVDQWPEWAKDIARSRQSADIGLGDTVVHLIGDERSERFKTWFVAKLGRSCGCTRRQDWLNRRFPYL